MSSPPMDHERCSELLPTWLRGELSEPEATAVRSHLEGCEGCAAERSVLMAMAALPEPEPLTDMERVRLRRALGDAVGRPPAAVPALSKRRSWGSRLYPALGAAAALVLIATFAYVGFVGGDEDGTPSTAADSLEDSDAGDTGGAGAEQAESLEAQAVPIASWGGDLGRLTDDELRALGASGGAVRNERAMSAADAAPAPEAGGATEGGEAQGEGAAAGDGTTADSTFEGVPGDAVAQLEAQAPEFADQIESCVAQIVGGDTDAVLAFGARGRYRGDEALVLGFLLPSEDGGFDRYSVWAFPVGDCSFPLHSVFGKV